MTQIDKKDLDALQKSKKNLSAVDLSRASLEEIDFSPLDFSDENFVISPDKRVFNLDFESSLYMIVWAMTLLLDEDGMDTFLEAARETPYCSATAGLSTGKTRPSTTGNRLVLEWK